MDRGYSEAVRGRYVRAEKKEKGRILDEFTQVTGYHILIAVRGESPVPARTPARRMTAVMWKGEC